MSNLKVRWSDLIKKCWVMLAIAFILFAMLFACFRALTPWAEQYKEVVETKLSRVLGQPVRISAMQTSWYWFEPVLRLEKVSITDKHKQVLKLDKLLVGINLWSSLWHWQIQPGVLIIEDVNFSLHQKGHHWEVEGLGSGSQIQVESSSYMPLLAWLLAQQKIILKNVSILVHLQDGSLLPISDLDLTVIKKSSQYSIRGMAQFAQTTPTRLKLLANLNIPFSDLSHASGDGYLEVKDALPAQWQGFLQNAPYRIGGGEGAIKLWGSLKRGTLQSIQSLFQFEHLSIQSKTSSEHVFLKSIAANLLWKPINMGWEIKASNIDVTTGNQKWPENQAVIRYRKQDGAWNIFLKHRDIASVANLGLKPPEALSKLQSLKPSGELSDTQLHITDGKPSFVLTRFKALGIKGDDIIPRVKGLSGVLRWQPNQGRLEIDSEKVFYRPKGLPALMFSKLSGALDWKDLSNGVRANLERLVVMRPDFIFTAQGRVDDLWENPFIIFEGLYSAQNAKKWLDYIPSGLLKPKLDDWLKHQMKTVGKASGRIHFEGAVDKFPFDNQEGAFSLTANLHDMSLQFNPKWPVTEHIEAFLTLDKRRLEIDVTQAELLGVGFDNAHVLIDDIGYDHEMLLIHSKNTAPIEDFLKFVKDSPLKERLSKLSLIEAKGPLQADIQIEIPLYPENDSIRAKGDLGFLGNELTYRYSLAPIIVQDLKGQIHITEAGINPSKLTGEYLNTPIDISIQSILEPTPATSIDIQATPSIEDIEKLYKLPIFNVVEGKTDIQAKLKLTDDPNDLDHLMLTSSMKGLNIDLPEPLAKKANQTKPFRFDLEFNPEKALHFNFDYNHVLTGKMAFKPNHTGSLELDDGTIQLGSKKLKAPRNKGLQLLGHLQDLNIDEWSEAYQKMGSSPSNPSLVDKIHLVELVADRSYFSGIHLKDLRLKAKRSKKDEWTFRIKQPNIKANLLYQANTNLLSGHFDYVKLPKHQNKGKLDKGQPFHLKPHEIPSLNITIDNFSYDTKDIGNLIVKGKSYKNHWDLAYCKVISPNYQITIAGDWRQNANQNKTDMGFSLKITHLAKMLQQWHISPVVEAKAGEVHFNGSWQGAPYEFQLDKLSGKGNLLINSGRITKLDPETEDKIGLGKLLSILSLQTIPRRLSLDFSDLSSSGYSFDVLKGSYKLKKGVMQTSDSYIDGPVAHASIKGSLDLDKRLYDLNLHVSPHITASLPVVATIAGGPIAGIATWVASKLINTGMQKISGYTYKISGPWLNPVVQQVSIIRKTSAQESKTR